ncbi:hypothetical protein FKM82_025463 [Ascaphus truei]
MLRKINNLRTNPARICSKHGHLAAVLWRRNASSLERLKPQYSGKKTRIYPCKPLIILEIFLYGCSDGICHQKNIYVFVVLTIIEQLFCNVPQLKVSNGDVMVTVTLTSYCMFKK